MNEPGRDGCDPRDRSGEALPEAWSQTRSVKRLSIDIPAELHRRIKVSCAGRGTKIADEVRALLEHNFQSR